jgi:hypothetical protein
LDSTKEIKRFTMPITPTDLQDLDESLGTGLDDPGLAGTDAPNGMTVIGAYNQMRQIAEDMADYGLVLSDLGTAKREEFERAQEDWQFHQKKMANVWAQLTGADDQIETEDGSKIDTPLAATSADGSSETLPADPRS